MILNYIWYGDARWVSIFSDPDKQIAVADMIKDGRWEGNFRRHLNPNEQLEWDLLRRDLGPVPNLVEGEDEVNIMEEFSTKKCYGKFAANNIRCNFDKFFREKANSFTGIFYILGCF